MSLLAQYYASNWLNIPKLVYSTWGATLTLSKRGVPRTVEPAIVSGSYTEQLRCVHLFNHIGYGSPLCCFSWQVYLSTWDRTYRFKVNIHLINLTLFVTYWLSLASWLVRWVWLNWRKYSVKTINLYVLESYCTLTPLFCNVSSQVYFVSGMNMDVVIPTWLGDFFSWRIQLPYNSKQWIHCCQSDIELPTKALWRTYSWTCLTWWAMEVPSLKVIFTIGHAKLMMLWTALKPHFTIATMLHKFLLCDVT